MKRTDGDHCLCSYSSGHTLWWCSPSVLDCVSQPRFADVKGNGRVLFAVFVVTMYLICLVSWSHRLSPLASEEKAGGSACPALIGWDHAVLALLGLSLSEAVACTS